LKLVGLRAGLGSVVRSACSLSVTLSCTLALTGCFNGTIQWTGVRNLSSVNSPIANQSTLITNQNTEPADNASTATITLTLLDGSSNPLAGKSVSLTSPRGGADLIAPSTVTTNSMGVAIFTVKSSLAGAANYSASDLSDGVSINQTVSVTYIAGPVSATISTVAASPSSVVADGSSLSTIAVTLKDTYGNVISGKTVTLSSSRGATDTITTLSGITNSSGVASFSVTSVTAGTSTFTALDSSDTLTLTQTGTLAFVPGPVSSTFSSITASPTSVIVGNSSTIAVTLKDANANFVSGKAVALTSSRGGVTDSILPASATTDATGVATFTVSSNVAGSPTYSARVTTDSVTLTSSVTVTYLVGSVNSTSSTISASPNQITADGATAATITVTLYDVFSNPVSGKTVTVSSSRGASDTITTVSGITNAMGVATFTIKSTLAGSATLTATDTSDTITLNSKASVSFTPGAVSAATSTMTASPASVNADGTSVVTINVALKDANGNPVSGKPVTLSSSRGVNDNISIAPATNAAGVASFSATSIHFGSPIFSASDTTDSLNITQTSNVQFKAYQLKFTGQPPQTNFNNANLSPQPVVAVVDASNTTDTSINAGTVTLSTYNNTSCATAVTSTQTGNTQTPTAGVANFNVEKISTSGIFYLGASDTALHSLGCSTQIAITDPLALSTSAPSVIIGNTMTVTATGGTSPYTFSVAAGGASVVPSGVTATYTAPPTASLTSSDTITVTDSNSKSATATINIKAPTSGTQVSIAAGFQHTCALVNGGVQCWGQGSSGQLGTGSTASSLYPVAVQGLSSGVQAIASGNDFTCALTNGAVKCWGNNGNGQLGNTASATPVSAPVQVQGLTSGVQSISAGSKHACAVVNGAAQCWGLNSDGQLGNGTINSSAVPVAVTGLSTGVQALALGVSFSCAIVNGGAQCWGINSSGQLGNTFTASSSTPGAVSGLTAGVQFIATGSNHGCAVINGAAQCWGSNSNGQLGTGSVTATTSLTPVAVSGLTSGVQNISAGGSHSCAVVNGAIQCWGYNFSGQLGNGLTTQIPSPVSAGLTGVTALASGINHNCAVANGIIQCWGQNTYGQLGNNATATIVASAVATVGITGGRQMIAVGANHTCALINGGVQCWGLNSSGQLGNSSLTSSNTPVQVLGLTSGVQAISAGQTHTCALVSGGVQCWGANSSGQLGVAAATTQSTTPIAVTGLSSGVQAIAAAYGNTCALVNGGVQCWGVNTNSELGNNSVTQSNSPVAVTGLTSNVSSISAGYSHSCAIINGAAQCWGKNTTGQLGNNSSAVSAIPVQVQGLTSGVQYISAGGFHSCAIVNGGAQCWGYNLYGQLGNSLTADSLIPVNVSSLLAGVQQLTLGRTFSCALGAGKAYCWGYGGDGEIGNGSTANVNIPTQVQVLSGNIQGIYTGGTASHACSLLSGSAQCWGFNSSGQLGNNTITNSSTPVSTVIAP